METQVKTVEFGWDSQDATNEGWYVVTRDAEGNFLDDSMKVWFPVEVDDYAEDESELLSEALANAFPGAEIIGE